MMTSEAMVCPQCGSLNVDRDEVDIGVGVHCGPWGCFDCGWTEGSDLPNIEPPPDHMECE